MWANQKNSDSLKEFALAKTKRSVKNVPGRQFDTMSFATTLRSAEMRESLRAACVTMNSQDHKERNLEQAEYYIEMASKNNADWVILPELFPFIGPYDKLYKNAEHKGGPLNIRLSELAQKFNMTIFAPVLELAEEDQAHAKHPKIYNTLHIFNNRGTLIHSYRKIHLFHLQYGEVLRSESDGFLSGNSLLTFTHDGWKVACAICYDIRFNEFLVALYKKGAFDILVVPSAFTEATGKAHWELLVRSRSVEFQCYTLAANQTGTHYEDKKSFGHSMIVDPWGDVIGKTGTDCGLAMADLFQERLRVIRERIPVLANRRNDLY